MLLFGFRPMKDGTIIRKNRIKYETSTIGKCNSNSHNSAKKINQPGVELYNASKNNFSKKIFYCILLVVNKE